MPTSARASAGRVVDPVADHRHRQAPRLQVGDRAVLVRGQHLGEDLVDAGRKPRSAATASATGRASPVIITIFSTPCARSSVDRLPGLGPDLVLERERADHSGRPSPSAQQVQHGRAAGRPVVRSRRQVGGHGRRQLPQQGRTADGVRGAVDDGLRRRARSATRKSVRRWRPAALGCGGRARWPGRAGARCRPRPPPASRSTSSSVSPAAAATPVTACAPLVRVPVLSNSTASTVRMRSSARRSLTRMPAFGGDRGRQRDDQRDGQAERVRAGDHQHGDRADHGLVDVAEQPTRRRR